MQIRLFDLRSNLNFRYVFSMRRAPFLRVFSPIDENTDEERMDPLLDLRLVHLLV